MQSYILTKARLIRESFIALYSQQRMLQFLYQVWKVEGGVGRAGSVGEGVQGGGGGRDICHISYE